MSNRKRVATKPATAAPKVEPKSEELEETLEEGLEETEEGAEPAAGEETPAAEPEEPKAPMTRKEYEAKKAEEAKAPAQKKPDPQKVKPTNDFILDAKGKVRKDADGDDMRYAPGHHKGGGYVNQSGVRFPPGFKFPGGHVGTRGNVVLNRCPKCGNHQAIDEAMLGLCANQKCGYSAIEELEEYALD